jgi:hypothetical protein
MIQELLKSNCYHALNQGQYFIYDNDVTNKPNFVSEDGKWNLNIVNETTEVVNFFQNDGCLMKQNELKKCDWICFVNNEFYFIEAKDVKMRSRSSQRNDAVLKFDDTIPYFIDLYPSIKTMKLIVVMNFRSSKITSATNKSKALYFDEKYNAEYRETNILEFNKE